MTSHRRVTSQAASSALQGSLSGAGNLESSRAETGNDCAENWAPGQLLSAPSSLRRAGRGGQEAGAAGRKGREDRGVNPNCTEASLPDECG